MKMEKKEKPKANNKSALNTKKPIATKKNKPDNVLSIWSILGSKEFHKEYLAARNRFKKEIDKAQSGGLKLFRFPLLNVIRSTESDPDAMVVEYVRILGKVSSLPAGQRKAILSFIEPIIKQTARILTDRAIAEKEKDTQGAK